MSNNPLYTKVAPKASPTYENLPAGKYLAIIKSIADWKDKFNKDMKVWLYDDNFRKIKDEAGRDQFEIMDYTTYSAEMDFEIIEPGFEGRTLKHWLKLHPNMPWEIPAFIDACGIVQDIEPAEIADYCVGAEVLLDVIIEDKPGKETPDPRTGVMRAAETKPRNTVRKVLSPKIAE